MLPEVILFSEAEDAVFGNADHIAPDRECLVVGGRCLISGKDGRIEPVGLETDPLGAREEFPRPGNGFLLKIVAEREVAQHFEIRAVTRGVADVFNITRADALLAGRHAVARGLFLAREPRLHRRHTGVDEQNGFVVLRNERKARQTQMTLRLKELQIHLPKLIETVRFVCHDKHSFYSH